MKWTLLLCSFFIAVISHAQNVAINADGSKANPNAMLDIKSTSKGLLIPRLTTEARMRIAPTQGLIVYDINTNSFWYHTGKAWQNIAAITAGSVGFWDLTGNAGTIDGTNFLGTTDNVPLNIRVNNQRSGRIDPTLNNTFWGFRSGFSITTGNDNTAVGASALFGITTGYNNTAVGSNALQSNSTGFHNTALGRFALIANTTGANNIAIGTSALFSNVMGSLNTAIGIDALHHNVDGVRNMAVGYQAMYNNNSGASNTAIGFGALWSNVTGSGNTAVGMDALRGTTAFVNTAVGHTAMANNTTGTDNAALGFNAMIANTTGNRNVAIGSQSMLGNGTGSQNVAIGYFTMGFTNGDNNIALGHGAMVFAHGGNNNTCIGGSTGNGFTGVENTVLGFGAMGIPDTVSFNTVIGARAQVTVAGIQNATALGYQAVSNASNKVRIGNAAVTVIEGQVPFTSPSDGRYKFGIQEDIKGLDFILQLRPVSYQFDTKRFDDDLRGPNNLYGKEITRGDKKITIPSPNNAAMESSYRESSAIRRSGFIAQEVEEAAKRSGYHFSGLIVPNKQQQHYSLSYESFVVPLVKAVQEQQQIINEQNKKIDDLQRKLDELIKLMSK